MFDLLFLSFSGKVSGDDEAGNSKPFQQDNGRSYVAAEKLSSGTLTCIFMPIGLFGLISLDRSGSTLFANPSKNTTSQQRRYDVAATL